MGNLLDYLQVFTGEAEDFAYLPDMTEQQDTGVEIRLPNTPREE